MKLLTKMKHGGKTMVIENKDCLEYLSTLENESVDLILTDPPYFIGFDGGKGWDSQWKTEQEYLYLAGT